MADKKHNNDFLTKHAKAIFAGSKSLREEELEQRWEEDTDLYNSKFPTKKKENSQALKNTKRLFIPKTYSHVQRMLVDLHDTFNEETDEIVDIEAWKDIPVDNREIVKTLLNYRLNSNPINFYAESLEACLDGLKNKMGIFKIYPKLEVEKVTTTFDDGTTEEVEEITEFSPVMDCVPFEDIFFDKSATWKDYWKYPIIHRMLKSKDYLKRRGYTNFEDIESANTVSTNRIKTQRQEDQGSVTTEDDKDVEGLEEVYIFEVWTFLEGDDGLLESASYVMGGSESEMQKVIRGKETNELPYKFEGDDYIRPPFLVGQPLPEPHVMAGKSVPEIVQGLQKETNAQRNQRREAVALSLRKPILASRGARINMMSLVNRKAGSVVLGDSVDPREVRELNISPPGSDSIYEQNRTDQDFFEATSIPPALLGAGSPEETATGTTSKNLNANKKISKMIRNMAATLFTPAMVYLLRLEQEYETDEFIMEVTGRVLGWGFASDGIPASEMIQGNFGLKVNVLSDKQSLMNKLFLIADRGNQANLTTMQLVQAGVVDPSTVEFNHPMKVYDRLLALLGEKSTKDHKVAAFPPAPGSGGKGQGSQPRLPQELEASITNLAPELTEGLSGGGL